MRELKLLRNPMAFALSLIFIAILISHSQRLIYVLWILRLDHALPAGFFTVVIKGLTFDFATVFYLFTPALLALVFLPDRWLTTRIGRAVVLVTTLVPLYLAAGSAACELFFFEEFHARFNFIAVDYLVYTHEVMRNIVESYSWPVVILTFTIPLVAIWIFLRGTIRNLEFYGGAKIRWQLSVLILTLATTGLLTQEDRLLANEAYWPRELSKNSLFALFSAYNRNSINFTEFYSSLDPEHAKAITETWLGGPVERFIETPGRISTVETHLRRDAV